MDATKEKILKTLAALNREQLEELLSTYFKQQDEKREAALLRETRVYPVCEIPESTQEEIERIERNGGNTESYLSKWIETIRALPTSTSPLPVLDAEFLRRAKQIWDEEVSGLEEVYQAILLHIVEYLKTGTTRPFILVGIPGCGKTHVMKTVGKILGLPTYIANAQQMASSGDGLSGHSRAYTGAVPGAIVQAMVNLQCGNPVFLIDEIDKVAGMSSLQKGNLQNELLGLTSDETRAAHRDSFLGFSVDASHMFIAMTANEERMINAPLLSRCDVITFREPACKQIEEILFRYSYPKRVAAFECRENVSVERETVESFVSDLYRKGLRDTRKYQSALESAVASAFLTHISTGENVIIDKESLMKAYETALSKNGTRPIGFVEQ